LGQASLRSEDSEEMKEAESSQRKRTEGKTCVDTGYKEWQEGGECDWGGDCATRCGSGAGQDRPLGLKEHGKVSVVLQ